MRTQTNVNNSIIWEKLFKFSISFLFLKPENIIQTGFYYVILHLNKLKIVYSGVKYVLWGLLFFFRFYSKQKVYCYNNLCIQFQIEALHRFLTSRVEFGSKLDVVSAFQMSYFEITLTFFLIIGK